MEIHVQSLLKIGVVVGVEYFAPIKGYDYYEFNMYFLFFRITAKWK